MQAMRERPIADHQAVGSEPTRLLDPAPKLHRGVKTGEARNARA